MLATDEHVAQKVLETFDSLPQKARPRTYPHGSKEWTVLSGIVVSDLRDSNPVCVSLGTGMRCLPHVKVAKANGVCLHDWHAEVLAIRGLNLFLLQECERVVTDASYSSPFIRARSLDEQREHEQQPFALRDGLRIHMYTSEAPCGDASMELTMGSQQDATPWAIPCEQENKLLGRGSFSQLGVVRRKPARADAPPSLSKSCSDKLAHRQCTSLLLSLTSSLVHPAHAYLHRLIIPKSQHVEAATARSFSASGRLAPMVNAQKEWQGGYAFKPFQIGTVDHEYKYCRPRTSAVKSTGSNISALWTPSRQEVLIGGSIQGNKQFSVRGASSVSRLKMWQKVAHIASLLGMLSLSQAQTYDSFKQVASLKARRAVKADARSMALRPWLVNTHDDAFSLQ